MSNPLFRQLFDPSTSTYSYLLADLDLGEAILLDSVWENYERDAQLIEQLGLKLKFTLETHIHADHVTGSDRLKKKFQCQSYVPACEALGADRYIKEGESVQLGAIELKAIHTPGHTDHHMSYLMGNKVFTGDALMINACGRTDFQSGDAGQLFDSVTQKLFLLDEDYSVFPAHDYNGFTESTIGEQKAFNPRFSGKTRDEFIEFMENLKLSLPQRMLFSVPKNMLCGSQDALSDLLVKHIQSTDAVLNLGHNTPYDTVALAKRIPCDLWQIVTFDEHANQMNEWITALKLERVPSVKTVSSFSTMQFKNEFDVIFAEALFDKLSEAECIRALEHMTQALKEDGKVILHGHFAQGSEPINQVLDHILRGMNDQFGLKSFSQINQWFKEHGYQQLQQESIGAGYEVGVWQLSSEAD